jgi:predicted DNA-binding transcriptional regulator YafY
LFAIVHAFIERPTWTQAELARRVDVGVPALRKRLIDLQRGGWPLERDEEATQVYWSVPKQWIPGALVFTEVEAGELLRHLARLPRSAGKKRLLEIVMKRLSRDALAKDIDPSMLVTAEVSASEEKFLSTVEDAAARRCALHTHYFTTSRGDLSWRHVSVYRIDVGPPARFLARCHRSNEVKRFRIDGVVEARLDRNEPFRPVVEDEIEEVERASLGSFRVPGPLVDNEFFVRDPDAAWVQRNLVKGMRFERATGGVRVFVTTTAVSIVARFVVGLGGVAHPVNPELRAEVAKLAQAALANAHASSDLRER